jgi:hypothetical protein
MRRCRPGEAFARSRLNTPARSETFASSRCRHCRGRQRIQADRLIFVTGGAFAANAQAFLARLPNGSIEKPFKARGCARWLRRCCADGPTAPSGRSVVLSKFRAHFRARETGLTVNVQIRCSRSERFPIVLNRKTFLLFFNGRILSAKAGRYFSENVLARSAVTR